MKANHFKIGFKLGVNKFVFYCKAVALGSNAKVLKYVDQTGCLLHYCCNKVQ